MKLSPKVYVLVTLVAIGLAAWLYTWRISVAEQRGYDKAQAEQTKATLDQSEANRVKEADWNRKWNEVQKTLAQERENARLARIAADSRYFRLQESIATEAAGAAALAKSAGISVRGSSSAWVVLREVLERYREVAGDADRYTSTIREARGWANIVEESK
ncbi:hypothetical protein AMA2_16 [Achromobacter phage AMA2]|nr:hypothetical protein AMA2_16 [Achromobacter phage AMA2]